MIDSHCHLTYISKEKDILTEVINRSVQSGIKYMVDIGVRPDDIDERIELLSGFKNVFLTLGYYPEYFNEGTTQALNNFDKQIESLNKHTKNIYAIGEIGIDYFHHDTTTRVKQMEFFSSLIDIASKNNLPILIHSRDGFADTYDVLKNKNASGIFHCFSYSAEEVKKALELNYLISFSGNITYKKSEAIREACKYVPNDKLTIETDAPYLSPQIVRSSPNEPSFTMHTAKFIADLRNDTLDNILAYAFENTKKMLMLDI